MNQNIFIIGPVAAGKNTLLNKLKEEYKLNVLDTGRLFRYLAMCINKNTDINPDYEKLYKNDKNEIERISKQIYNRNRTITGLIDKLQIQDGELFLDGEKIDEEELYSKEVNSILSIVAQSNLIRKRILNYINTNISKQVGNYAMTGHTLNQIDTTKLTTIFLDTKDERAAKRLYERNPKAYSSVLDAYKEVRQRNENDGIEKTRKILPLLYNNIYIDTTELSEEEVKEIAIEKLEEIEKKNNSFSKLQKNKSIKKKDFKWILNPFLEVIKQVYLDKKIDEKLKDNPFINKTDLEYQVLINLCAYKVEELFKGDLEILYKINQDMNNRNDNDFRNFAQKIIDKEININQELVEGEIEKQMVKLEKLYDDNYTKQIMEQITKTREDNSLNDIEYKKVDEKTSQFLAKNCHYLHTPREDEYVSYGAFVKGEILPIAWVSFSKQDREYKKQLLNYLGIESQNTLEMTRAWNSDDAPKNTMSSLFQYAINDINKEWKQLKKQKKVNNNLQAITTTINPNLGFKASAFLGSNFIPFALRPANLTYGKKGDSFEYMTRREINRQKADYFENQLNILPLNEMILCLNNKKQKEIEKENIFVMEQKTYDKILEGEQK